MHPCNTGLHRYAHVHARAHTHTHIQRERARARERESARENDRPDDTHADTKLVVNSSYIEHIDTPCSPVYLTSI